MLGKQKAVNAVFPTLTAYLKQMTGIEPASPAWEAGILPMNYICIWHVKNYNALLLKLQDFSQSICQSMGAIP